MYFITTKRMLEVCFFQHTPTFIIEPFITTKRMLEVCFFQHTPTFIIEPEFLPVIDNYRIIQKRV